MACNMRMYVFVAAIVLPSFTSQIHSCKEATDENKPSWKMLGTTALNCCDRCATILGLLLKSFVLQYQ